MIERSFTAPERKALCGALEKIVHDAPTADRAMLYAALRMYQQRYPKTVGSFGEPLLLSMVEAMEQGLWDLFLEEDVRAK